MLCCPAEAVQAAACSTGLELSGPYAGPHSSAALLAVLETPCSASMPARDALGSQIAQLNLAQILTVQILSSCHIHSSEQLHFDAMRDDAQHNRLHMMSPGQTTATAKSQVPHQTNSSPKPVFCMTCHMSTASKSSSL